MSALPYSSAFKWSRSVKDIYMRGKANLKKFFSESFCKLGKKQTSRSNQYSTSPPALILHFLPGRLPHGLPHGHSEVLVKIISTSTSPSPFLSYLNVSWQQPWTQLTPLLLGGVSTPSPPSFHLDCPVTAPSAWLLSSLQTLSTEVTQDPVFRHFFLYLCA